MQCRVRQAKRYEVVDSVDVGSSRREKGQGRRPVHGRRRLLTLETHGREAIIDPVAAPRPRIQILCGPQGVGWGRLVRRGPYDVAGWSREPSPASELAQKSAGASFDPFTGPQTRHARRPGDHRFGQQRPVRRHRLWTEQHLGFQPIVARRRQEVAAICCDAGPFAERQIIAVHTDRTHTVISLPAAAAARRFGDEPTAVVNGRLHVSTTGTRRFIKERGEAWPSGLSNRLDALEKLGTTKTVIESPRVSRPYLEDLFGDTEPLECDAGPWLHVVGDLGVADDSQAVVVAHERLQDIPDYRAALQGWFKAVAPGGRLVVTVPHAFLHDRALRLEQRRRPDQKRLYTPASLLQEVEEALTPNTYRVRRLNDADNGYDYGSPRDQAPQGAHHIVLVLEKIARPSWAMVACPAEASQAPAPDFDRPRTRVEFAARAPRRRILALKLDHLGDFIMGLPALEALRSAFPDSEITLVVGSWNLDLAQSVGVADQVLAFDVFPRNSSEERVDVPGKTALFETLITQEYDLAIDLRVDPDTRDLLSRVRAGLRAGMGTRNRFPYLDIFLPVDFSREEPEQARRDVLDHHGFHSKDSLVRSEHRIYCDGAASRDGALIWGPYWSLRAGRYVFEPFLDIESEGSVLLDVGLDTQRECGLVAPSMSAVRLPFSVSRDNTQFEFRVWPLEDAQLPRFSFYGGRLVREGAAGVLHQSEYGRLLIELIRLRTSESGLLHESVRL